LTAYQDKDPGFGQALFHELLNHYGDPVKMLSYISRWFAHVDSLEHIHLAYHHGIKLEYIINDTVLHKYMDEIKNIAQIRGLEWVEHHPKTKPELKTRSWLTSGMHLFKHSPGDVYDLLMKGRVEMAEEELAALKHQVEEQVNKHFAKEHINATFTL
jgi:transcriptional regulator of aromatic amino acid metabolism